MPALAASQEMQERAAAPRLRLADHRRASSPRSHEELGRARAGAVDDAERREEFGDLLLVVVNLARKHGVEAEAALRAANDKFRRRFGASSGWPRSAGSPCATSTSTTLDALWDAAKDETQPRGRRRRPAMTIGNRPRRSAPTAARPATSDR